MKRLLLTTLTALMLMPLTATAQDDMYFVPTKSNVKKSAEKYGMTLTTVAAKETWTNITDD